MEILRNGENNNILLNQELHFRTDAGWQENCEELEKETLKEIINPIDNYETIRYIHKNYLMPSNTSFTQNDIWFYFYFYNITGQTFNDGLDYNHIGLTYSENARMLKQTTESFFRLEFYKTPNDEPPDKINRKFVFARTLALPLGEKYFYAPINDYIFLPVFTGSNYRNKENMYLFWFIDDSAIIEPYLTGNTFWMTARFFNSKDGTILNFMNSPMPPNSNFREDRDMYYKVVIDRSDYSYTVYRYDGTQGTRIGESDDPIKFYELIN